MGRQIRVKSFMRRMPGSRKKVRVKGFLRIKRTDIKKKVRVRY